MFIRNQLRFNIHASQTIDGVTYPRFTDPALQAALGITEIPDPAPPEDYSDDTYYRTEQDTAPYVVYTRKSDEQIALVILNRAKAQRAAQVEAIKVTTQAGHEFDGDEVSQTRMARAILALQATNTPTVKWVLANNVPTDIPLAELQEALALAGAAQAAIWSSPYGG